MKRINEVDAAFDIAAAETGIQNDTAQLRVCAAKPTAAARWTKEDDDFLRANLGQLTEEEIARRLHRTPTAVHLRRERDLHLQAPSKHRDVITAERIAIGLGMDGKSIHRLIDRGILPGRRLPSRYCMIRLVDRRTLAKWLLDPENWAYIHTDRVGGLRPRGKRPIPGDYDFAFWEEMSEAVKNAHRRWKDEWLRPGQVARMLSLPCGSRYVNAAIRKGTLQATRWGNWWIRRSSIPKGMTLNFRGDWVKKKK